MLQRGLDHVVEDGVVVPPVAVPVSVLQRGLDHVVEDGACGKSGANANAYHRVFEQTSRFDQVHPGGGARLRLPIEEDIDLIGKSSSRAALPSYSPPGRSRGVTARVFSFQ